MKRDVSVKSFSFEDTRRNISVPLAMRTNLNLNKKVPNFQKKRKKTFLARC